MALYSLFTDRKYHQPFRQLVDRGYWIYSPQKNKGNQATWNINNNIYLYLTNSVPVSLCCDKNMNETILTWKKPFVL